VKVTITPPAQLASAATITKITSVVANGLTGNNLSGGVLWPCGFCFQAADEEEAEVLE
jgi:hypothetical protein